MINENYDKIDGKYVKNESNYYHYTNTENFHHIAASLAYGDGLRGSLYDTRLDHTYGGKPSNEVCLVRSDRVPDRSQTLSLSGNVGDIKFTFKEDKLQNKFGKIRPIQEFPIQDRLFVEDDLKKVWNATSMRPPIAQKTYDNLKSNFKKMTIEEFENGLKKLSIFCSSKNLIEIAKRDFKTFKEGKEPEHMESRVKVPQGKFITLDLIDKIMIPDYLKNNKEVLADIQKLKTKGFNDVVFYHCRWPKDPDETKKRKLISEAKLNNKVNKYKQSYFPY